MKEVVDRLIHAAIHRPQRGLFALLDAARDPEVYEAVMEPGVEARCLYVEELPDELARAAPYIVDLDRSVGFVQRLREAWGKSWGILARSSASLDELRRHFKGLNIVQGPDGQRLLFRYYDPRVLRVYLPPCTPGELAQVFGPVTELVTEGDDCPAIRFTFDGEALSIARHDGPTPHLEEEP
jgi:hypothetical protein